MISKISSNPVTLFDFGKYYQYFTKYNNVPQCLKIIQTKNV